MTTKTKPGIRTTEFWFTLASAILGFCMSVGWIDPDGTSGADQIGGMLLVALSMSGYGLSRGIAKHNNGGFVPVSLLLCIVGLALIPGLAACDSLEPVSQIYLEGDRETFDSLAPAYIQYVESDPTLTNDQKELRLLVIELWEARLVAEEMNYPPSD